MNATAQSILACLEDVARERRHRAADAALDAAVHRTKEFQHRRFERTYADLLSHPRYAAPARFFLEDLYGPYDFADRDAQFARIVPALVRLFPGEIVETVGDLAALHALSERLDTAMAHALTGRCGAGPWTDADYAAAWAGVGDREQRLRQVTLMRRVGDALEHYTRRRGLRQTLRLMRLPARAAGLGALHGFLERGFDTFHAMAGSGEFLDTIESRERRLVECLFAADGAARAAETGLVAMATAGPGQVP